VPSEQNYSCYNYNIFEEKKKVLGWFKFRFS
jgi:hypothetical protein